MKSQKCFVCKICADTTPIGLKSLGCREIYICKSCNEEMNNTKVIENKKALDKKAVDKKRTNLH